MVWRVPGPPAVLLSIDAAFIKAGKTCWKIVRGSEGLGCFVMKLRVRLEDVYILGFI